MMQAPAHYFTHLECSETGERYEADQPHNLSKAGKPLLARYDLEKMKAENDRGAIWARGGGFWKWRELLPVADEAHVCALGEIDTPLIDVPATGKASGATGKVWVKDEGRLPTGSFKERGGCFALLENQRRVDEAVARQVGTLDPTGVPDTVSGRVGLSGVEDRWANVACITASIEVIIILGCV